MSVNSCFLINWKNVLFMSLFPVNWCISRASSSTFKQDEGGSPSRHLDIAQKYLQNAFQI